MKGKIKTGPIGQRGEQLAAGFLQNHGYRILRRNYRCRMGEIDIIAWDGPVLCFVEVRTRSSSDFGYPFETVLRAKRQKWLRSAQRFLQEARLDETDCRFDMVSILFLPATAPQCELLRDVFELTD